MFVTANFPLTMYCYGRMMSEDQPLQGNVAEQSAQKAVNAADPIYIANTLQMAMFRSDAIEISDQTQAVLSGFMNSMIQACSALIECCCDNGDGDGDGDGSGALAASANLPDEDNLIASVFTDGQSLLLLFCRTWEAELAKSAAACANYAPECPPIWAGHPRDGKNADGAEQRHILTNAQAAFLNNAQIMHLDQRELSATQWRRIVLPVAHKLSAHTQGHEATLRDATHHLLINHDEAQARLVQMAMFIDEQPDAVFDHSHWRRSGPSVFLLGLANRVNIPFDAIILASAMHNPAIFALALLAAGSKPQDVLLIMGETPMASSWLSSISKAQSFAAMIASYNIASARKEMLEWVGANGESRQMVFDHWPWSGVL